MKNLLFSCLFLITYSVKAQRLELKTSPFNIFKGTYVLAAEYIINDNFSIEVAPYHKIFKYNTSERVANRIYGKTNSGIKATARYFFMPITKCDNLGIGVYTLSYINTYTVLSADAEKEYNDKFTFIGCLAIYKWVAKKGFLAEFEIGGGRAVVPNYATTFTQTVNGVTTTYKSKLRELDLWSPSARIAIGYRFGTNKKSTK